MFPSRSRPPPRLFPFSLLFVICLLLNFSVWGFNHYTFLFYYLLTVLMLHIKLYLYIETISEKISYDHSLLIYSVSCLNFMLNSLMPFHVSGPCCLDLRQIKRIYLWVLAVSCFDLHNRKHQDLRLKESYIQTMLLVFIVSIKLVCRFFQEKIVSSVLSQYVQNYLKASVEWRHGSGFCSEQLMDLCIKISAGKSTNGHFDPTQTFLSHLNSF